MDQNCTRNDGESNEYNDEGNCQTRKKDQLNFVFVNKDNIHGRVTIAVDAGIDVLQEFMKVIEGKYHNINERENDAKYHRYKNCINHQIRLQDMIKFNTNKK